MILRKNIDSTFLTGIYFQVYHSNFAHLKPL